MKRTFLMQGRPFLTATAAGGSSFADFYSVADLKGRFYNEPFL